LEKSEAEGDGWEDDKMKTAIICKICVTQGELYEAFTTDNYGIS
jgi:hypothetical protein